MRYKKEILIAGSIAQQRAHAVTLRAQIAEKMEHEEKLLQSYADDQVQIEKAAREILLKAENAEEISREYLDGIFKTESGAGWRERLLGLDRSSYDSILKSIRGLESELKYAENEKPMLVSFLEAIEDETVSDYGLKQAGFTLGNIASLIKDGLEELRGQATAGQAA